MAKLPIQKCDNRRLKPRSLGAVNPFLQDPARAERLFWDSAGSSTDLERPEPAPAAEPSDG